MYKDCLKNEINIEVLQDDIFNKIPDYLLSSSFVYEFLSVKCSKLSYKKLIDAYITDLRIIICYNSMFHQLDPLYAKTDKQNLVYNYNFFVFKICELKDQSLYSSNLDYIKLKFVKQVDIKYVKKRKLPLIVLQNDSRYSDYSKKIHEIKDLPVIDYNSFTFSPYDLPLKNLSIDSFEDSCNSSNRSRFTNRGININAENSDFEEATNDEVTDGSCTPLSKFSSTMDDTYYKSKANTSNSNFKNLSDNYDASNALKESFGDYNDHIDFNDILSRKPSSPSSQVNDHHSSGFEQNNATQAQKLQQTNFDSIVLALPANQYYFPNDTVKDFEITNDHNKDAILQLLQELHHQRLSTNNNNNQVSLPKGEIIVGLLFTKNSNESNLNFISSVDQINHVGVKAKLTSYSLINDLTTEKCTLIVSFQILSRIKVECLFLPKYNQLEPKQENYNIEDYLSFVQYSHFDFQIGREFKMDTYLEILKHSLTFFKIYCNILNKLRKSISMKYSKNSKSGESLLKNGYKRLHKIVNLNIDTFKKSNDGNSIFKLLENNEPFFSSKSSEFLDEFSMKIEFLIDMIRIIISFKNKQKKSSSNLSNSKNETNKIHSKFDEMKVLENLINSDNLEYICDQIAVFFKNESELLVHELKL